MQRKSASAGRIGTLPVGRLGLLNMGDEYCMKLDKLARKWKCETLSEAAIEVLRDAIDKELENEFQS